MVFSHGFLHPDLGSVSQDDESQQSLLPSPHFSPGLQVAASWSTTAIECTGDFFFGGFGRWSFVGWALNGIQRHFCWKIQKWHPFFCWILRNECAERSVFFGARVTMTLFLMKCELLPFYCHLPLMWITKRTRSTYVEKDFPFWKPCLKISTDLEISSYIPLN